MDFDEEKGGDEKMTAEMIAAVIAANAAILLGAYLGLRMGRGLVPKVFYGAVAVVSGLFLLVVAVAAIVAATR